MKPLFGIRVLDLGRFITAPLAAQLLGELGADVIKVESPEVIDPFRSSDGGLYSAHFQSHNRNKRSLALNFGTDRGKAVLDRLIARADVLLLNMRPGAEARAGLQYERLRELNPGLIYCAITGFGADGPYAHRPAFDNVGQALSGWLSMFHKGSDPRVPGPPVSDSLTGVFACVGILGALVERASTGKGRKVEVSMLESMIAFATEPLGQLSAKGAVPTFYSRAAASQSFVVTCSDGARIGLHLSSPEKFWTSLVDAIGQPSLLTKYPTREIRVARYDELSEDLSGIFALRPRAEWLSVLEKHDVPAAPELRLGDLRNDPQVNHLGTFYEMVHPVHGKVIAANRAIRYDGDNRSGFRPPPAFGEHSDDVLQEAGLPPEEIAELRAARVIC